VSAWDQSPHRILNKHKESGLHVRTETGGYNTHDCLTMLSLFLAIAIRAVNHPYLKMVIKRMCHFFNAISKNVIDVVELDEIHKGM
jgi:hypothetical protein